ncbi:MAG TPA: DUF3017 domain-containing protein [Streptosporangiaceae bacterium]|nr:DUF3017 domain-containing protein [Streptosporangiaceae bacterium]
MKHSAKAAAKTARRQARLARRGGAAGADGPAVPRDTGGQRALAGNDAAGRAGVPDSRVRSGAAAATAGRTRLTQLPYALVLAGIALGLALMCIAGQAVKSGTLVIAGALLAGSVARLLLPDAKVGMLRSRRRLVDVALLTALGAGLLAAGLIVQVPG